MKIIHNVPFNFHPVFIPFNQLLGAILDFGLRIEKNENELYFTNEITNNKT